MMKRTIWLAIAAVFGSGLLLQVHAADVATPAAAPVDVAEAPAADSGVPTGKAVPKGKTFQVYSDARARGNHYVPSGWMGDWGDIKMNENYKVNPHSGKTAIMFAYNGKGSQGANWAGVFWQNPANNWGTKQGGFDLTGAKRLTFWARGDKGGERIEEFKLGGITGEFADSDEFGIGPIDLEAEWKQYTIDLTGMDLSYISGGFCWATNVDNNPNGLTFYVDDIQYEFE